MARSMRQPPSFASKTRIIQGIAPQKPIACDKSDACHQTVMMLRYNGGMSQQAIPEDTPTQTLSALVEGLPDGVGKKFFAIMAEKRPQDLITFINIKHGLYSDELPDMRAGDLIALRSSLKNYAPEYRQALRETQFDKTTRRTLLRTALLCAAAPVLATMGSSELRRERAEASAKPTPVENQPANITDGQIMLAASGVIVAGAAWDNMLERMQSICDAIDAIARAEQSTTPPRGR
jgi:hypothetical protein